MIIHGSREEELVRLNTGKSDGMRDGKSWMGVTRLISVAEVFRVKVAPISILFQSRELFKYKSIL